MSFYGSLGTAVQGINAQAVAIGHISENVANATSNGYKQVNTAFHDLVTNKLQGEGPFVDSTRNMGVMATADFANRRQGQIVRDSNTTSIAVSGNGFIPVMKPTGVDPLTREPTGFEDAVYYTRLGDFRLDNSNRLVNSAGYYLQAAEVGGTTPADFVVDDADIAAEPTSIVNYRANLPASALTGRTFANGIGIIDADGVERSFQMAWEKTANNTWELTINTADGTPASFGPVTVTFNNGVLDTMVSGDAALAVTTTGAATASFSTDFGAGAQAITVNLGEFGGGFDVDATSSLTQYSSQTSDITNFDINQNGLRGGQFTNVTFDEDGQIIYNYTNSRSQVGGQLLLANFAEPDRLDRADGTAFLETRASGEVVFGAPNADGMGSIVASALEQSNVDVAEQMTRLIVAQQAYSMNGQVLTASDQMMSRAIDMKR